MRTLYIDCGMGAAGDMLTAALLELQEDPAAALRELNALGIPGVVYRAENTEKCGIRGTRVAVTVSGEEEGEHEHHHHHQHHQHHHHHSDLGEIREIISRLNAPEEVRADVLAVYEAIAAAESTVHGVAVEEVHFHEVGAMDAVADVAAVSFLLYRLAPLKIAASPVHVGSGTVRCAHGVLPVPAPAAAELLRGIPIYGGSIAGELCTPTGAALLRRFVSSFGAMPPMTVEKMGYGMGKKDFERPNCVRMLLGAEEAQADTVLELSCNLDDMTAEEIGFAMEQLLSAGALDVWTTPIGMKKNRPGTLLSMLLREKDKEELLRQIFRHTTTLGVRETRKSRYTLTREEEAAATEYGEVRRKTAEGYGVRRVKAEYEDLARIARENGLTLRQARAFAER